MLAGMHAIAEAKQPVSFLKTLILVDCSLSNEGTTNSMDCYHIASEIQCDRFLLDIAPKRLHTATSLAIWKVITASCNLIYTIYTRNFAGLGGSVGCAVRLETRRSRDQPPPRSATFFRGD